MSTIKQIEANRKNAQKSTGPTTKAGKAKASRNAIKHGILSNTALVHRESSKALDALSAAVHAKLQPEGAVEELLVESIVSHYWRLRRLQRVESGLFNNSCYEEESDHAVHEYLRDDNKKPDSTGSFYTAPELELPAASTLAKRLAPSLGRAFVANAHAFGTLSRYEQQLNRNLQRLQHELEREQARRRGENVSPPVAVDLTLNGGLLA